MVVLFALGLLFLHQSKCRFTEVALRDDPVIMRLVTYGKNTL